MPASWSVVVIGSVPDDRRGDPPRARLVAEPEDHVGELLLRQPVHEVGGARAFGRVHPHVERPVLPEAEAAFRPIELHRGDPEIEEHAADLTADRVLVHLGEPRLEQPDPVPVPREPLPRDLERVGVAIDAEHGGRARLEQCCRVATGSHGHVDHRAPAAEQLDHLRRHDGLVSLARHPKCPTSSPNAIDASSVSAIIPMSERL